MLKTDFFWFIGFGDLRAGGGRCAGKSGLPRRFDHRGRKVSHAHAALFGAALKTRVEMMPCNRFHFGRESLHVWGIPVGDLADECVVLRLDFAPGELDRILEGVSRREI